jgi:DNA-binding transcriptional ArsR family regulator
LDERAAFRPAKSALGDYDQPLKLLPAKARIQVAPIAKTTAKKKAKKKAPALDSDLIKVMGNPTRWFALNLLNQRVASPKEIANELGIEVSLMSYHVDKLRKAGMLELVTTAQRRGATEHYYRAIRSSFFSDKEWGEVPLNVRAKIVADQHAATTDLLRASVEDGTFERREDRHHTHIDADVDEQGWQDTMRLLEQTMNRVIEIKAESAERRLGSDAPSVPLAVALIGFERSSVASS